MCKISTEKWTSCSFINQCKCSSICNDDQNAKRIYCIFGNALCLLPQTSRTSGIRITDLCTLQNSILFSVVFWWHKGRWGQASSQINTKHKSEIMIQNMQSKVLIVRSKAMNLESKEEKMQKWLLCLLLWENMWKFVRYSMGIEIHFFSSAFSSYFHFV